MNKPIYEPRGRAREYGELAVNIYTGCNHGCFYCYAPAALRKSRNAFADVQPRTDIVKAVWRQIDREEITGKTIFLCFTCDPYPADIDTKPTRAIIQAIKGNGNRVRILTKAPSRTVRDWDLLDDGDEIGTTITGPTGWSREHEPKADDTERRLLTLESAHASGLKTWVSLEPVFFPGLVYKVIRGCDFIDFFKIGKLNHAATPPEIIEAGGWAAFGGKAERLCREYGRAYYIKEDLRAEMEREPHEATEGGERTVCGDIINGK